MLSILEINLAVIIQVGGMSVVSRVLDDGGGAP